MTDKGSLDLLFVHGYLFVIGYITYYISIMYIYYNTFQHVKHKAHVLSPEEQADSKGK